MSSTLPQVPKAKNRRLYIDWMRGLACLLMFQTHVYDSWLSPPARNGKFFDLSQRTGGMPAPMFLFLAGISMALLTQSLRRKGMSRMERAKITVRRGFKIFLLGLAFRAQEFITGLPGAPWTDLLRVDILNMIGMSLMLMGLVISFSQSPRQDYAFSALATIALAMLTPWVWYARFPKWVPWIVVDYLNGGRRPWFFPVFPWVGFAFAGLFVGTLIISTSEKFKESTLSICLALAGVWLIWTGLFLDRFPFQLYAVYDYWHTSPNFFAVKLGVLFLMVAFSFWWCEWLGGRGFSWVAQMGQTSLLVYWLHIPFVYGKLNSFSREFSVLGASIGLALVTVSMLVLSILKTRYLDTVKPWITATRAKPGAAIL